MIQDWCIVQLSLMEYLFSLLRHQDTFFFPHSFPFWQLDICSSLFRLLHRLQFFVVSLIQIVNPSIMDNKCRMYLSTSMALTTATLIFLSIVGFGCTIKGNNFLDNLYLIRVSTSVLSHNGGFLEPPEPEQPHGRFENENRTSIANIPDFYHVGLWNLCSGTLKDDTPFDKKAAFKSDKVTECTARQTDFWFDPIEIWGLNQAQAREALGEDFIRALSTHTKAVKWRSSAFIIAMMGTCLEFLFGVFASIPSLRRYFKPVIGTVSLVGIVSSIFITAFAFTATILYGTFVKALNQALQKYHVDSVTGFTVYIFLWFAVIFSWVAAFFWLLIWRSYIPEEVSERPAEPPGPEVAKRPAKPPAARSDPGFIPFHPQQNIINQPNYYMPLHPSQQGWAQSFGQSFGQPQSFGQSFVQPQSPGQPVVPQPSGQPDVPQSSGRPGGRPRAVKRRK